MLLDVALLSAVKENGNVPAAILSLLEADPGEAAQPSG
jgi:hypothetical protein